MAFKQTSSSLTNLQFLVIDDREVPKKLSKTISQIAHTFIFPFFFEVFSLVIDRVFSSSILYRYGCSMIMAGGLFKKINSLQKSGG